MSSARLLTVLAAGAFCLMAASSCSRVGRDKVVNSPVKITGTMRRVMQQGELSGTINLDTIRDKTHLFGVGPIEYLRGEIMVWDGVAYSSIIEPDLRVSVDSGFQLKAPFFVYANIYEWKEYLLPDSILDDLGLEAFLVKVSAGRSSPFAFRISATVDSARIHVVSLPEGTVVSTPDDAHLGQQDFLLADKSADILGFFSMEHQGVFTHHDSYVHMHLITADRKIMGHVDDLKFRKGTPKICLSVTE